MLSWDQIEGHTGVKDVLERAVAGDRLHHGLLFAGPMGVGKRAMALAIARALNCSEYTEGVFVPACEQCPSCRKMSQNAHPDLVLVEPDGKKIKNIKIAQVREVQAITHRAPFEARERVIIFDDAHLMTEEAANALLKTLEEPTPRTRLMLITDQPHLLLDTIISRCQMLRFGALERAHVERLLARISQESESKYSPEALAVAAGYGEGSVGRAWGVLSSGVLEARKEFVSQITALEARRPRQRLELAETLGRQNQQLPEQLDMLKVFLRDVLMEQVCDGDERVINRDILKTVRAFGAKRTPDQVLVVLDKVCEAEVLLQRNVNPQMVMEDVLRVFASH